MTHIFKAQTQLLNVFSSAMDTNADGNNQVIHVWGTLKFFTLSVMIHEMSD